MSRASLSRTFACAVALASLAVFSPGQSGSHPDRVKSTRKIQAKLIAFETGDYEHAIVSRKGKETDYYIGDYGLDYFMSVHANQPGTFTVEKVDSYIQENNGYMMIDRIKDARFGRESFAKWWKKVKAHKTNDQIDNEFSPRIQKLQRNPG